jgi:hypothetical protein
MANRKNFFFRQKVTEAELDAAMGYLEDACFKLVSDQALFGIHQGGSVDQKSGTPNLTVDLAGPSVVYDKLGRRISWASLQNLNCAVDSNNV